MDKQLYHFLQNEYDLEDPHHLTKAFRQQRHIKKGQLLIKPEQKSDLLAFIKSGSFRVYFHSEEGFEITTWFSFANRFVTDLYSYYYGEPAFQYVEAIEESTILIAKKCDLENLYDSDRQAESFGRKFAENGMMMVMKRMMDLQTRTAKERYLALLGQPKFLQKIPLKYLATYLGITDTSLSRIRREVADQKAM